MVATKNKVVLPETLLQKDLEMVILDYGTTSNLYYGSLPSNLFL